MRKLVIVIFFLLFRYPLYSQTIEQNKIYKIYNVPNLSAENLFTEIHLAISLLYQDSNDVIKYLNEILYFLKIWRAFIYLFSTHL